MLASFEMPIPVNGLCLMSVIFFCACCFIMFLCLFVYKIEPLVRRARLTEAASMWEREDGFKERFDGFVMQNSAVAPSANQSFKPKTASPRL